MLLVFLSNIIISLHQTSTSYGQTTPTPSGLSVVQGINNLGQIQLFTIPEILVQTGIQTWRDLGWTGAGRKIGVLDRGFGNLFSFEKETNRSVTTAPGLPRSTYNSNLITHGTEVLEVIQSVAPNATLFVCQYQTFDEFVPCVSWMIGNGVHIINHSAGVPALPLDGTNSWAREVDRATRAGIVWVNAAGNFAGGYVSDFFTDSSPQNTYHEFRGTQGLESLGISSINQAKGIVSLSWEGTSEKSANEIDLDLEILDENGNLVDSSAQTQSGQPGQLALEYVAISMKRDFYVRIRDSNGEGVGAHFVLFIEFAALPAGVADRSIIAPGDSQNALTVGSLQGNVIAPYSSRGPVGAGAIKPDIVAPGEIKFPNGLSFVGTSAAAPIVAGAIALIWEAFPTFSRDEVVRYLKERAIQDDSIIPGADYAYGNGTLYLAVPEITPTPIPLPSPTSVEAITTLPPASVTISPIQAQTGASFVVVKVPSANLRRGPGSNYSFVDAASKDDQFEVIARSGNGNEMWYLVKQPTGKLVWIWSELVSLHPENASIPFSATVPPLPATPTLPPTNTPTETPNNGGGTSSGSSGNSGQGQSVVDSDGDGVPDSQDACPLDRFCQ